MGSPQLLPVQPWAGASVVSWVQVPHLPGGHWISQSLPPPGWWCGSSMGAAPVRPRVTPEALPVCPMPLVLCGSQFSHLLNGITDAAPQEH